MNEMDRKKLQENHERLVNDVKYYQISAHLLSTFVLDYRMDAEIKRGKTEHEQMEILLGLLPSRGKNAMKELITALKKSSPWLADTLEQEKDCDFNDNKLEEQDDEKKEVEEKKDISISRYISDLRKIFEESPTVINNWKILAYSLRLEYRSIADIQFSNNFRVSEALIQILQTWLEESGEKATFGNLINVLRREKLEDTANKIEKLWSDAQEADCKI